MQLNWGAQQEARLRGDGSSSAHQGRIGLKHLGCSAPTRTIIVTRTCPLSPSSHVHACAGRPEKGAPGFSGWCDALARAPAARQQFKLRSRARQRLTTKRTPPTKTMHGPGCATTRLRLLCTLNFCIPTHFSKPRRRAVLAVCALATAAPVIGFAAAPSIV